jgi:hypothetical protein
MHVTKIDGGFYFMCCLVVLSIDRSLFLEDEHVLSFSCLFYSILYFFFSSFVT